MSRVAEKYKAPGPVTGPGVGRLMRYMWLTFVVACGELTSVDNAGGPN